MSDEWCMMKDGMIPCVVADDDAMFAIYSWNCDPCKLFMQKGVTPPCGVGNAKLVYNHYFFLLAKTTGAAMAASRTRFRHTPACS